MKNHRLLTHVCLHQIDCLCYCCYAKTSYSAVQKRHSKVYGNPIAPSFYSISPCVKLYKIEYKGTYLSTNGIRQMQILKTFLTLEALVYMQFVLYQLKELKSCIRKLAKSCFISAFYRLSDLYGGILIKMFMQHYEQTTRGGDSNQPRQEMGGRCGVQTLYISIVKCIAIPAIGNQKKKNYTVKP